MAEKRYWLVKSEPGTYGIDDLARDGKTPWNGVRNYRARNFMRDEMKVGDLVFYYHSNADPPGIVGVARVASEPYPDASQFDSGSPYFDPGSDPADPRWQLVDLAFVARLPRVLGLPELKERPELAGMPLLQRGQRLSVQPVPPACWKAICALAGWSPARRS